MPEISYHLVESMDPYWPFGAKEVGEGPITVAGAAIIAAVSDALGGTNVPEMPMTPWRVIKAIRRQKESSRTSAGSLAGIQVTNRAATAFGSG
jgi:4-hydroxybenzoyl-CoA reductase subunit alpha